MQGRSATPPFKGMNAETDPLRNRSEAVGSTPTLILGGLSFDISRKSVPAIPPFKVVANDLFVGYYVFAALLLGSRLLRFV